MTLSSRADPFSVGNHTLWSGSSSYASSAAAATAEAYSCCIAVRSSADNGSEFGKFFAGSSKVKPGECGEICLVFFFSLLLLFFFLAPRSGGGGGPSFALGVRLRPRRVSSCSSASSAAAVTTEAYSASMFASSPADSGTGSGGKTRGVRLRPRVCFLSGSVGGGLEYFGLWDRLVRDVAASERCFVFRRAGTLGGGAGDGTERFARLVFGTELRGGSGGLERRCIRAGCRCRDEYSEGLCRTPTVIVGGGDLDLVRSRGPLSNPTLVFQS